MIILRGKGQYLQDRSIQDKREIELCKCQMENSADNLETAKGGIEKRY